MIDRKKLLAKEQTITPTTMAITVVCVLSGLITLIFSQHSLWQQWTVISHILSGVGCTLLISPYLFNHFRRTVGFRRPSVLLSGLLTLLIAGGLFISGWHIMVLGRSEPLRWVFDVHLYSALFFVLVVIIHVALHIVLLPANRKNTQNSAFPSLPKGSYRPSLYFISFTTICIVVLSALSYWTQPDYSDQASVQPYEYSYGKHPFRPSQTETVSGGFIDKRQVGQSQRCVHCHEDVGNQWMSSIHKQAASDPTYVSNVSLLAKKKGISATRYCEGCHAPIALLSGELSTGGEHGGISGTMANIEGVSCMGCHGIENIEHLKGVASFRFHPKQDYLFADSDNGVLQRIHDMLIRVRPDQHIKDLGRPILKDPKFCSSCHTQFMDKDMNNWGWIKMQDEYSSWLNSPYSNQHRAQHSDTSLQRCQDCHMPLMASNDPSSDSNHTVRSHHYPGANTFLPLLSNDTAQFEATKSFLQSNKLRINIDKPNRTDAVQTLMALDESLRSIDEAPYYFYLEEEATISLVVSNRGVGHDFPGGTIDINEAWISFDVFDAQGEPVYSSGNIQPDHNVDPNAYFYRALATNKQGHLVWKHDLFNMTGESFKRVIKAGESDIVSYSFAVPSWVKSPLTVTATLRYRKLNARYAKWALKDQYFELPVIDLAWDSLQIPIKIRKEVE